MMSDAADRVWLAKNVYGGWYVLNPGAVKWHKDSPVYIRADLHEQLQAEVVELRHALDDARAVIQKAVDATQALTPFVFAALPEPPHGQKND